MQRRSYEAVMGDGMGVCINTFLRRCSASVSCETQSSSHSKNVDSVATCLGALLRTKTTAT